MNNFGVNLLGKSAIYSKAQFFKQGAQKNTRTFICEGGPGCDPKGTSGGLGLTFGARTISGRWQADGERDIIDANALESYVDAEGREVGPEVVEEKTDVDVCPATRKGKPAPPVASEVVAPATDAPPVAEKPTKSSKRIPALAQKKKDAKPKVEPAKTDKPASDGFDNARCVELYKSGTTSLTDLAEKMGYPRGSGQNRCRRVLQAAGVMQA